MPLDLELLRPLFAAADTGYVSFQLIKVNALDYVLIGLRQAWAHTVATIGSIDNDWQMGLLLLDIVEEAKFLRSVQIQIQKAHIRSEG